MLYIFMHGLLLLYSLEEVGVSSSCVRKGKKLQLQKKGINKSILYIYMACFFFNLEQVGVSSMKRIHHISEEAKARRSCKERNRILSAVAAIYKEGTMDLILASHLQIMSIFIFFCNFHANFETMKVII